MRDAETAMTDRPIASGQVEQDGQAERNGHAEPGRPSECRTPASVGRFCECCGGQLKGRKKRFCSDRCRMRARRTDHFIRIASLVTAMENAVAALKDELLNETKVER